MKNTLKSLYTNARFFYIMWGLVVVFAASLFRDYLFSAGVILLSAFIGAVLVEFFLLYPSGGNAYIRANRRLAERFSNGDMNEVAITVESHFPFPVNIEIIDEIPYHFQIRDFLKKGRLVTGKPTVFKYGLRPLERGEYVFGALNVYVKGRLGLLSRRYRFDAGAIVKVYPSFIQMRRYEIMAISNRLNEVGVKKIRRIGHHSEFDQIREYIKGDDIRTINWRATARVAKMMVNQFRDERSQQIFCLINMGRSMKMPFDGLTLLDYAINTSLVMSNIAILRHDKTGLVTFDDKIRSVLPARAEGRHMQSIMEVLYKQTTSFSESNYEALYTFIRSRVHQRSLFILFTNFESIESARREIDLLTGIASKHLLMLVFFENEEVSKVLTSETTDAEEIYKHAIAEKFIYDKKQIVKELERRGIYALLTKPEKLTVDTMNKYLEFKSRGLL